MLLNTLLNISSLILNSELDPNGWKTGGAFCFHNENTVLPLKTCVRGIAARTVKTIGSAVT